MKALSNINFLSSEVMSSCTLQPIYQIVGENSEDSAAFYTELSGSFSPKHWSKGTREGELKGLTRKNRLFNRTSPQPSEFSCWPWYMRPGNLDSQSIKMEHQCPDTQESAIFAVFHRWAQSEARTCSLNLCRRVMVNVKTGGDPEHRSPASGHHLQINTAPEIMQGWSLHWDGVYVTYTTLSNEYNWNISVTAEDVLDEKE